MEGGSDLEALDEEEDGNDFADLLMAELEPDDAEESSQQQRQPPAQKEKPNDHEAHRELQEATTKRPTALFASASKPSQKSKEAGLDGANRLSEVTLPGSITAKSHTLVGKSAGKAPAGVETQQVLPREGSYAQQGDFKRVKFNTTQSFSPGCPPKGRNPQPPEVPMPALEQGGAEAWEDEKASRKRKGQKMYQVCFPAAFRLGLYVVVCPQEIQLTDKYLTAQNGKANFRTSRINSLPLSTVLFNCTDCRGWFC